MTRIVRGRHNLRKVQERTVRAVTFLPNGQRFQGWLPAGYYEIIGEASLTDRDRGDVRCLKIERRQHLSVECWYVALSFADTGSDYP